jgi:putative transcriptional regulator
MGIIVRLDRVLADRKMGVSELAEKIGITLANLSNLKTGKVRAVRFSTLEAICAALDCQPGDILEYIPSAGQADSGDDELAREYGLPDEG